MTSEDLHARRVDAVRAWTRFVEAGDADAVRPEILRSWELSGVVSPGGDPRAARRRGRHGRLLEGLAPADRGVPGAGRAPAHGRGRRPRRRGHRRADADPLDLRRPRDATQGRDGELRPRRPVGRGERRHQRAGHRRPHRRPVDGLQRRALRRGRAQLGLLGGPGLRPGDRPLARRDRPVDHLGPLPPHRPRHGARDGAADRGRPPHRPSYDAVGRRRAVRARPHPDPPRHGAGVARRPAAAPQPAADRDPRPARAPSLGALGRAPPRAALRRRVRDHLDAQGRGLAPASGPVGAALVASLPPHHARGHRRRGGAAAAAPR